MREAHVSIDAAEYEAMGIEDLISLGENAGLVDIEELACYGTGAVVRTTVERRYDEEQLEALEYVDRWEHLAETDGRHVYLVAFTAPDLPESVAEKAGDLIGTCDPELDDRGATVSLVGPQEAIAGTIGEYETAGVSANLQKLGSYDGQSSALEMLTERQREVLQTAYDSGYYDVPRSASTADVAAELDLDPSTVTEHLQRAERNLIGSHLE